MHRASTAATTLRPVTLLLTRVSRQPAATNVWQAALRHFAAAPEAAVAAAPAASESSDEFLNLRGLVERLRQELPSKPTRGAPIDGQVVERVSRLLQQTRLNPREWRQHAIFRRGRYTRNIVGYAPNQFIALLLSWERGQQSPIHDHSGSHCFVKMLAGRLNEQRFAWSVTGGAQKEVLAQSELDSSKPEQSVAFMHDSLGLHRIVNPSNDEVAVSLHIYSPPFTDCLVFPPTGGSPRTAPMVSINDPTLPSGELPQPGEPSAEAASPSLHDLCSSLGKLSAWHNNSFSAPDPEAVFNLLVSAEMLPLEWATYASPSHFSEFHVGQNLIHCDDEFSVIVSCWAPGQSVPPHTLGQGRQLWMKVLHGSLRYEEYAPGMYPWECDIARESELPEGSTSVMEECGVRMHRFVNSSDTVPAVSVHVFSPPLTQFTFRTERGVERRDVPSLLGSAAQTPAPAASPRGLMRTAGRWYLSFRGLIGLLDGELARRSPSFDLVTTILRKAVFNPDEWRARVSSASTAAKAKGADAAVTGAPLRILLSQRPKYTLLLSCWPQHGGGAAAPHGAEEPKGCHSWTLVLEGELEERVYKSSDAGLMRARYYKEDSLTFLEPVQQTVRRGCDSDVPCIALHVYTPALPEGEMLASCITEEG